MVKTTHNCPADNIVLIETDISIGMSRSYNQKVDLDRYITCVYMAKNGLVIAKTDIVTQLGLRAFAREDCRECDRDRGCTDVRVVRYTSRGKQAKKRGSGFEI